MIYIRYVIFVYNRRLVEQNAFLDSLPAYGTLGHAIAAHLTSSVAAQENHIAESVHAHWTHSL